MLKYFGVCSSTVRKISQRVLKFGLAPVLLFSNVFLSRQILSDSRRITTTDSGEVARQSNRRCWDMYPDHLFSITYPGSCCHLEPNGFWESVSQIHHGPGVDSVNSSWNPFVLGPEQLLVPRPRAPRPLAGSSGPE